MFFFPFFNLSRKCNCGTTLDWTETNETRFSESRLWMIPQRRAPCSADAGVSLRREARGGTKERTRGTQMWRLWSVCSSDEVEKNKLTQCVVRSEETAENQLHVWRFRAHFCSIFQQTLNISRVHWRSHDFVTIHRVLIWLDASLSFKKATV